MMLNDIWLSIAALCLILISSFSMYLPLLAISKDNLLALKYAIPFSISIEILVGYIFYCSDVRYFPAAYLAIVILTNLLALYKLRPLKISKPTIKITAFFALIAVASAIFYTRYQEAFRLIGPVGTDAGHHINFVADLLVKGLLPNGYYAPGFHLFIMPIAKVINLSDLYRFAGPAIGITTVIAVVLFVKDFLKNKILILILLALLAAPIFNQFILQTITFFSSSLSFIPFVALIALVAKRPDAKYRSSLLLAGIFCLMLALSVPYLFITLAPAFLILTLIVFILKKKFPKGYPRYVLAILLIVLFGVIASLGHVIVQSKFLHRFYGFPNVKVVTDQQFTETGEGEFAPSGSLADSNKLPKFVSENIFLKPLVGTTIDVFKIKTIRPLNNILGLGGYLWIAFSLFLFVISLRRKNNFLLTVALMSIVFGIFTQTGLFEVSSYKGRSGWYLMLLSIFGIVAVLDETIPSKFNNWILVGCILIASSGFISPPKFYQGYYEDEFRKIREIAKQVPDRKIKLVSGSRHLNIVSPNLVPLALDERNVTDDDTLVVIEKIIFKPDPLLAKNVALADKNFTEFNKKHDAMKAVIEANIERITSKEIFKQEYKPLFENNDFIIYGNF